MGEFVTRDGEPWYRISGLSDLPPFLVNLPTDTDLWMFISSTGGLTAGRRDPDGAFFPYETVDKLHDALPHTGPVTLVRWGRGGAAPRLWEPLALSDVLATGIERSLSKNLLGNRLVFEEIHLEAQLAFRYRWAGSDETGWVRTATLTNTGAAPVTLDLLDGLRNVLPSGAPLRLYQRSSSLVDAYKRVDVDAATGLGIFSLTAEIIDRPEPAEMLRATTAWCHGLPGARVALSGAALRTFRRGQAVRAESLLTGRRGNYFVTSTLTIEPGQHIAWHIGVDSNRSHIDIASLRARLRDAGGVGAWVEGALGASSEALRRIVASADGLQLTGHTVGAAHHFANVLYNNLRGGVFVENYACPKADLLAFIEARNHAVAARCAGLLTALPAAVTVQALIETARANGDADLRRLCFEYLPLYFGRRHGDPSRPWNTFSIHVRNADGSRALRYEGNWRDVFQNWEALSMSFPGFLPGIIAKFVNASTIDGFNPYRITRDGVDWEVLDPRDPWGGIGYWGDHQLIYLLKFLESMRHHAPGGLENLLTQDIFSYADVPYRLKPYTQILEDPRATIEFDEARHTQIQERVRTNGFDGKLVRAAQGGVYHANLLEKLIVPALSKLSNFVPGGGIWMNTERPEWNDANNALVGNGLSVVTLCYLRRYLAFVEELFAGQPHGDAQVSIEVVEWLRAMSSVLQRHHALLAAPQIEDRARKQVMDELGEAFTAYRDRVYASGFSGKVALGLDEVLAWCREACAHVDHSILVNRRDDDLYHSYNVLALGADGSSAAVRALDVMLEGQVAVLSSGLVGAPEATELLAQLFASPLYSPEQKSFLLYPDKPLPSFLERNRIPADLAARVPLVVALLAASDTSVLDRDADGVLRFHADFSNARDVADALDRLERSATWSRAVARDRRSVVELFEAVFSHDTFTGRSGTMYAYEGLGSIYWHMVAKLLLAVQEVFFAARATGEDDAVCAALAEYYFKIRGGLGFEKSVGEYGAFPADPYSHTPAHAGAQQPGMTGQVKEEILTRFGELGVRVNKGIVEFAPVLLQRDEFLTKPGRYEYYALDGQPKSFAVPAGELAFSYGQVPVVYLLEANDAWIRVTLRDGSSSEVAGWSLSPGESRDVLAREGRVTRIEVGVPERQLFKG